MRLHYLTIVFFHRQWFKGRLFRKSNEAVNGWGSSSGEPACSGSHQWVKGLIRNRLCHCFEKRSLMFACHLQMAPSVSCWHPPWLLSVGTAWSLTPGVTQESTRLWWAALWTTRYVELRWNFFLYKFKYHLDFTSTFYLIETLKF